MREHSRVLALLVGLLALGAGAQYLLRARAALGQGMRGPEAN